MIINYWSSFWRFYNGARDANAEPLKFTSIGRDKVSCRGGDECSVSESFSIDFSDAELRPYLKSGFRFKALAKAAKGEVLEIPPDRIVANVAAVDALLHGESAAEKRPVEGPKNTEVAHAGPRLGFKAAPITAKLGETLGLKEGAGLFVAYVEAGSRADSAGLQVGDVILAVNGSSVSNADQMTSVINCAAQTGRLKLEVLRAGEHDDAAIDIEQ